MNILLPVQPGSLLPNACYTSEQSRLNDFAAHLNAALSGGLAFYNYGDTKPDPSLQSYPWLRTVDGRWYSYSGKWKASVGTYDTNERRWFAGSLTDLITYDGGDSGSPSTESGPMWQEDTDFIGRSPMHPGLIPETAAFFSKTLAVGENYGDGSHAQTVAEMAAHTHSPDPTLADSFWGHAAPGSPATGNMGGGGDSIKLSQTASTGGTGATPNVVNSMSLVQPSRGLYCIKRTNRNVYVVP